MLDLLELELETVVSHLRYMLRHKQGSPGSAANALNYSAGWEFGSCSLELSTFIGLLLGREDEKPGP